MSPAYSVCIVHYGDAARTRRCVASCRAQEPAPVRVVVVCNGPGPPPTIDDTTVIDPGENLGFAAGANRGIAAALDGHPVPAIMLLNNDTVVAPGCVAQLLDGLAGEPRAAMVGPRILSSRDDHTWHEGGVIAWPEGRPAPLPPGVASHTGTYSVEFVSGCAPLLRVPAFQEVGGFDERYFLTYEDADLSLRLRRAGWLLLQVPAAVVRHEGSASLGEGSPQSRYYRLRNRLLFASLHAPEPAATARALARLERRSRWRALRWLLTGKPARARALWAALADARSGRYGRR